MISDHGRARPAHDKFASPALQLALTSALRSLLSAWHVAVSGPKTRCEIFIDGAVERCLDACLALVRLVLRAIGHALSKGDALLLPEAPAAGLFASDASDTIE